MRRMRMVVLAATALIALIVAGVALADTLNNYTTTVTAHQNGAGTAKKPVALGLVQKLSAAPNNGNAYASPLTDIKLTLPDVKVNQTGFPVCSAAAINSAQNDTGCPRGAKVASGPVSAELYPAATPSQGTPCSLVLDVWNAGKGKLTYFFTVPPGHTCGGLQTGAAAAWTGTVKQSGNALVDNTPLPADVSTSAGNIPGIYSALLNETLTFNKLTAKIKGKVVPFLESVGCVAHKRPSITSFTAVNGSQTATTVIKGSSGC